jgi:hypothetical protein
MQGARKGVQQEHNRNQVKQKKLQLSSPKKDYKITKIYILKKKTTKF